MKQNRLALLDGSSDGAEEITQCAHHPPDALRAMKTRMLANVVDDTLHVFNASAELVIHHLAVVHARIRRPFRMTAAVDDEVEKNRLTLTIGESVHEALRVSAIRDVDASTIVISLIQCS